MRTFEESVKLGRIRNTLAHTAQKSWNQLLQRQEEACEWFQVLAKPAEVLRRLELIENDIFWIIGLKLKFGHVGAAASGKRPEPAGRGREAEMGVLPVPLHLVTAISTLRISIPPDLRPPEARKATLTTVRVRSLFHVLELCGRLGSGTTLM